MKNLFHIIVLIIITTSIANAQSAGIHFEQLSTWQQVLTKAKTEHKYIFVDCFATWCGPCKEMDERVYPLKQAGEVYNNQFINIKLQMDRTAHDSSGVKQWYETAEKFAQNYKVDAYPTFLFFDENGRPVHKVTGSQGSTAFMKLATDARDPRKQYYRVLEDFASGKLDTADEKGLAHFFMDSDKPLAGQLAADYLSRIPKKQLGRRDNGQLMVEFQEDPTVQQIIIGYIKRQKLSSIPKLGEFLAAVAREPAIRQVIRSYLIKLPASNYPDLAYPLSKFKNDAVLDRKVSKFIAEEPENRWYTYEFINLITVFTQKSEDPGFNIFYLHTRKIDSVVKDYYWAQRAIGWIISDETLQDDVNTAKKGDSSPHFSNDSAAIAKKYNSYYAAWAVLNAKLDWYNYLIKEKKRPRYWPDLISAHVKKIEEFGYDTLSAPGRLLEINNTCYNEIFLHSSDTLVLATGIRWMKRLTEKARESSAFMFYMDTYACLLYRYGKTDEAINAEAQVLRFCVDNRKRGTYTTMIHTTQAIRDMWKGEHIWEMKEYQ